MGYGELINICRQILDTLNNMSDSLFLILNNILYCLIFIIIVYVGFKCMKGYRI